MVKQCGVCSNSMSAFQLQTIVSDTNNWWVACIHYSLTSNTTSTQRVDRITSQQSIQHQWTIHMCVCVCVCVCVCSQRRVTSTAISRLKPNKNLTCRREIRAILARKKATLRRIGYIIFIYLYKALSTVSYMYILTLSDLNDFEHTLKSQRLYTNFRQFY